MCLYTALQPLTAFTVLQCCVHDYNSFVPPHYPSYTAHDLTRGFTAGVAIPPSMTRSPLSNVRHIYSAHCIYFLMIGDRALRFPAVMTCLRGQPSSKQRRRRGPSLKFRRTKSSRRGSSSTVHRQLGVAWTRPEFRADRVNELGGGVHARLFVE